MDTIDREAKERQLNGLLSIELACMRPPSLTRAIRAGAAASAVCTAFKPVHELDHITTMVRAGARLGVKVR